jgi:hypothetical protein
LNFKNKIYAWYAKSLKLFLVNYWTSKRKYSQSSFISLICKQNANEITTESSHHFHRDARSSTTINKHYVRRTQTHLIWQALLETTKNDFYRRHIFEQDSQEVIDFQMKTRLKWVSNDWSTQSLCRVVVQIFKKRFKLHHNFLKVKSNLATQMRTNRINLTKYFFHKRMFIIISSIYSCDWFKQITKHVVFFCSNHHVYKKNMLRKVKTTKYNRFFDISKILKIMIK